MRCSPLEIVAGRGRGCVCPATPAPHCSSGFGDGGQMPDWGGGLASCSQKIPSLHEGDTESQAKDCGVGAGPQPRSLCPCHSQALPRDSLPLEARFEGPPPFPSFCVSSLGETPSYWQGKARGSAAHSPAAPGLSGSPHAWQPGSPP